MKLVDTHAHLFWKSFKEDFDQMIQRAVDAGVTTIINVGVDIEKSKEALKQAQETQWPIGLSVYCSIGIHPHEVLRFAALTQDKPQEVDVAIQEDMDELEEIYKSSSGKIVAIGECGLDFVFQTNDLHPNISLPPDQIKRLQRKLFQAQIDLARKLKLPLLVHCRDDRSKNPQNTEAWNEVIKMVGTHQTILHCYSGLPQTTNLVLSSSNLTVSFAGNITYPKNDYLREAVKLLPLDRIVLETDCPFLPPQSKRGQRNEPAFVYEVAQTIAEIKSVSLEEVARKTTENANKIFAL